jgi:crossover junction endodeoxyribonuclease RuvC
MKILGIDPGTRYTGYGLLEVGLSKTPRALLAGRWSLIQATSLADRLVVLESRLSHLIETEQPSWIAVERAFFSLNAHSALLLGHARGVILLVAKRYELKLLEFSVTEAKKAVTTLGRANKLMVAQSLSRQLQQPKIATLPHDATDALSLALTAFLYLESEKIKDRFQENL